MRFCITTANDRMLNNPFNGFINYGRFINGYSMVVYHKFPPSSLVDYMSCLEGYEDKTILTDPESPLGVYYNIGNYGDLLFRFRMLKYKNTDKVVESPTSVLEIVSMDRNILEMLIYAINWNPRNLEIIL